MLARSISSPVSRDPEGFYRSCPSCQPLQKPVIKIIWPSSCCRRLVLQQSRYSIHDITVSQRSVSQQAGRGIHSICTRSAAQVDFKNFPLHTASLAGSQVLSVQQQTVPQHICGTKRRAWCCTDCRQGGRCTVCLATTHKHKQSQCQGLTPKRVDQSVPCAGLCNRKT